MMHRHTCSQNTHICKMNWEKNVIVEVKYAEPHLEENFKLSFIIAFCFLFSCSYGRQRTREMREMLERARTNVVMFCDLSGVTLYPPHYSPLCDKQKQKKSNVDFRFFTA